MDVEFPGEKGRKGHGKKHCVLYQQAFRARETEPQEIDKTAQSENNRSTIPPKN